MDYTPAFLTAFNSAMLYEVGPFFNATDPDVIAGTTGTPQQNRNVGFTNTAGDAGGVTKFGIAQNSHPSIDVASLTLDQAMQIYVSDYWTPSGCPSIAGPVSIIHFDGCVNNGVGRACKFLQEAAGVTPVDGRIGPNSIATINAIDPATLIHQISSIRSNYYNTIVQNNPAQSKFLNGWLNRIAAVTQLALSQI